jgi:hypothetical protein
MARSATWQASSAKPNRFQTVAYAGKNNPASAADMQNASRPAGFEPLTTPFVGAQLRSVDETEVICDGGRCHRRRSGYIYGLGHPASFG